MLILSSLSSVVDKMVLPVSNRTATRYRFKNHLVITNFYFVHPNHVKFNMV